MIDGFISFFRPSYPSVIVYMLQSSEYKVGPYLRWFWKTPNFSKVMYRGNLKKTRAATALLLFISAGMLIEILVGLALLKVWTIQTSALGWYIGVGLVIAYPIIWAHLLVVPLVLGRWLIVNPLNAIRQRSSDKIFANHKAEKIAVAGSYGKTSMKELLLTVLKEGKNVAATPANKNVSSSHSIFAKNLTGKEDILIIEYGEGAPGDVARFARLTHPDRAVITGLAPAHLDKYKTLDEAGKDIFSLSSFVPAKKIYVNEDSRDLEKFIKPKFNRYNSNGALGWKVTDVKVTVTGTSFTIKKGRKSINLFSGLVGRHHLGSLTLAAALGIEFGLTEDEVISGIANTKPFEHRMQPYPLNGAWVIDDTYNGNLEGIRAGTDLMAELKSKKKIYITPGLVDQGSESEAIHNEVGRLIAKANPNQVILIKNSVCDFIKTGLIEAGYSGEITIEDNPLRFYQNLKEFVANGDLVVLQNDWPDQYK